LAAALCLGALTRFWHLGEASPFSDEAFTFALASLPLSALLHALANSDYHPPLFYLWTHALLVGLHWLVWDYRYLSAPFGLVTIAAAWAAARRISGEIAAAFAAIVVALAPGAIAFDRMFRMYGIFVALATVSWWTLLESLAAPPRSRRLWWTGYALVTLLLAYTHYLAFIVLACQAAFAAMRWPHSRPAFFAYTLVLLAYVPWFPSMLHQFALGGMALVRPGLDAGLAQSIRGAFAMGLPDAFFRWTGGIWWPLAAVCAIGVWGGWLARRTALPFWLGSLGLAIGLSIVFSRNLAYFPRYLLVDIPPVAIALGVIVEHAMASGRRLAALAIATASVALLGVASTNVLLDPYYQFPDWYAVNAFLAGEERPTDAIILDAGYEQYAVAPLSAFRGHPMLAFMNPSDFATILRWIDDHPHARIWYIEHQNAYWDPQRRIAASLARSRAQIASRDFPRQSPADEVAVFLFDKVPMNR